MEKEDKLIIISLKEYKELLEIKGKYEELKSAQPLIWYDLRTPPQKPGVYYKEDTIPYKITCKGDTK